MAAKLRYSTKRNYITKNKAEKLRAIVKEVGLKGSGHVKKESSRGTKAKPKGIPSYSAAFQRKQNTETRNLKSRIKKSFM